MRLRRSDGLAMLAGAALGAVAELGLAVHSGHLPQAIVLGAAIGTSRPYPRTTWLFAAALLLATAAGGAVPGDDEIAVSVLVAAHAGCAGRWDGHWKGLGGPAALLGASMVAADLADMPVLVYLFVVPTAWAAGRALRDRELVAAELAQRAGELEEERDAFATLSVRYERARIAAELHDIVAHAISVMVVQASAGQRLAGRDPDATAPTFDAIAGAARQAEQDMGRLVDLLGDEAAIAPAPDVALVEELTRRASGSGLDVTLRLEGDREGLPAPVGEIAYRVVQEGLTNALRYAAGAAVSVLVRGDGEELLVEVQNASSAKEAALDGVGMGTGLRGLRERVSACGGTFEAGRRAVGGWQVRARLPRHRQARSVQENVTSDHP